MNDTYNRDSIDEKFARIHDRLDTIDRKFDAKFDAVISQTTRTNGTVRRHEKLIWAVGGAAIILAAMGYPNLLMVIKGLGL